MTASSPILTFESTCPDGRIHALRGSVPVGRIYPLSDGRATWYLDLTDERGAAKSVDIAKQQISTFFIDWMIQADLTCVEPNAPNDGG